MEKNSRLVTLMGDFESSWVNGEACLNNYKRSGAAPDQLTEDKQHKNSIKKIDNQRILEIGLAKLARNDFKDEIRSFVNCLCKLGRLAYSRFDPAERGRGAAPHGGQGNPQWN